MAWLSQSDIENYGTDLIDVVQRGALHALTCRTSKLRTTSCGSVSRLKRDMLLISESKGLSPTFGPLILIPPGIPGWFNLTRCRAVRGNSS